MNMLVEEDFRNVFLDPQEQEARKSKSEQSTIDLDQYEIHNLIQGIMDGYGCDNFMDLKNELDQDSDPSVSQNVDDLGMELFGTIVHDTIDQVIHPDNNQFETARQIIGDNNTDPSNDDVEEYKQKLAKSVINATLDDDEFDPKNFLAGIIDDQSQQCDTSKLYHEFVVKNDMEMARPAPPPTKQFSPAKTYDYEGPSVNLEFMNEDGSPKTHVEFKPNKSSKPTMH